MPMSKSHMSHSYLGEEEARPLVEWMNRVGNKKRAPVVNLYRSLLRMMLGPQATDISEGDAELGIAVVRGSTAYGREAKKLQRELKSLHRWPEMSLVNIPEAKFELRWTSTDETVKAKLIVVELAIMGLAQRLRPCKLKSCRKWFFARYKHQWFCCTPHQQSFYRQGTEWKEHRRKWSKEYRKLKASGLVK